MLRQRGLRRVPILLGDRLLPKARPLYEIKSCSFFVSEHSALDCVPTLASRIARSSCFENLTLLMIAINSIWIWIDTVARP